LLVTAISTSRLLYGYLGDTSVRDNMTLMADYWLDHGLSKANDLWGNLPYPYNTVLHSGVYDGLPSRGVLVCGATRIKR
jgi:hypothetical protein